jgi:hypothetical protein
LEECRLVLAEGVHDHLLGVALGEPHGLLVRRLHHEQVRLATEEGEDAAQQRLDAFVLLGQAQEDGVIRFVSHILAHDTGEGEQSVGVSKNDLQPFKPLGQRTKTYACKKVTSY